jgi:hypothetical protein
MTTAVTQTINFVPVQGVFAPEPTYALQYFVGPAGTPFYGPANASFTNISTVTGTITTTPVGDTDIANKAYVDSVAQGLDIKASCVYSTTGNITLSGLGTQAGGDWPSTLTAGDRVLVKNQTLSQFNGIYVAAAGTWARSADMNVWAEVPSAFTFIQTGTTLADTGWVCTANKGGTIDVTAMPWSQFSGAGSYLAGNGLQLTGNTFSVLANGTTINVSASGVKISDTYVGQSTITTLGTITSGTWNGGIISPTYGGSGVNNGSNTLTWNSSYTLNQSVASGASPTFTGANFSSIPNGALQNSTISGIFLGSNLASLTIGSGLSGTSYNGSAAVTITNSSPMVYPGAGIPNSTGSSWGTSYTTSGSGTVLALNNSPSLTATTQVSYENWTPIAAPAYLEGRVWYDSTQHLLAFYNDVSSAVTYIGQDTQFRVVNGTGSTIANGAPVYITSTSSGGQAPNVALAKADVASTSAVIGLANGSIASGATGMVVAQGAISNVNTGTFTVGQVLYLSPYSAGQLMNTIPPTGITVQVGIVSYVDSSAGRIFVKQTTPLAVPASIITGQVALANGGTGANLTATAGGVLYSGASVMALTAAGTAGQVLTSNGSSAPSWSTPTAYATVTDDTTTNSVRYPLFANQTTGNLTTEYVSSTRLNFNPSTGLFTATEFSGSGASLTSLPAGQLSGTIPSGVLGNSSLYIGTTSIALNRASASQSLTGVNIDGSAGSATTATTATNATNVAITDDTSTAAEMYVSWVTTTTGNLPMKVSSTKLKFNPSTGVLTATGGVTGGTF